MADILPFRPRARPSAVRLAPQHVLVPREDLEEAAHAALDCVDRLIAILDRMDGDPDLEPSGDDEPSLGAPEEHGSNIVWFCGTARDLELDQHPETML